MHKGITYDDVLLVPQYSDIISRKEVDLTTDFKKGIELSLPIIASPMDTVSEADMAGNLGELGGLSIIHRYNTVEEQSAMIASLGKKVLVGAAVGVLDDYMDRSRAAIEAGAKVICIDVAHGHHVLVKRAILLRLLLLGLMLLCWDRSLQEQIVHPAPSSKQKLVN